MSGFVALCVDGHEDLAGLGFAVGTAEIIFTVGVERAALRIPQELVVDGAVIIDVNLFRPERPRCGDFTEVAPDLVGGGDFLTQRALLGAGTIAAIPPLFLIRFGLGAVSYASQTPGGLFAPMLVLGAQMGLFFGLLFRSVFSDPSIQPEAFAIVGMAAFFCGVVRSPLTGIVLVTEMTGTPPCSFRCWGRALQPCWCPHYYTTPRFMIRYDRVECEFSQGSHLPATGYVYLDLKSLVHKLPVTFDNTHRPVSE